MDEGVLVSGFDLLLTMDPDRGEGPLGAVPAGALRVRGGLVDWVGPANSAPEAASVVQVNGGVGLPGLVDSHTHAVWAGSRVAEWRRKLGGEKYEDILASGGGILSTVRGTRAASDAELLGLAAWRLRRARAQGVTTIEVKSGYGLSRVHEARLLHTAREAARDAQIGVMTTWLGAHTVPAEHRAHREAYLDELVGPQLAAVRGLADFVDAYIDKGAFSLEEGERVLSAGKAAGLGVRVHAEQVSHTGAAAMAARLGALSADHLERLDEAGVAALAASGTVAGLLPGAMLYLRDQAPPVAALREAGVPMAVASDLNPGTSPVASLWTCATLACLAMGLTVEEALLGITANGARALGRADIGRLAPGCRADLCLARPAPWDPALPESLLNGLSGPEIAGVWRAEDWAPITR